MFLPVTESLRRLGHLDTRAFTSLYLPNHHSYSFISLPMGTPSARMGFIYHPASRTLPGSRLWMEGAFCGFPRRAPSTVT
jgi:hypothetical protein